jgi:AcrR family transcriptional regulator
MSPPRRRARTQEQRSQATTRALVSAAGALFATQGFATTSLDQILRRARVTRGALYHHFDSKTALFRAVVEEQEQALAAAIAEAARGQADAWRAFRAGCRAFLDACLDPKLQRLLLLDGPSVLGWDGMRELEGRYTFALIRGGLERAMAEGQLGQRPVEPLTHLLLGALSQCAMAIARSPHPAAAVREAQLEVDRLLAALTRG